jgi:solute:Na+ symporter, SSS family
MNTLIFFGVLVVLAIASLVIGKTSSKNLKGIEDYFLGGRTLGVFALAITLLATQLGGGTLVGAAEEAYRRGWIVILYPLGNCLGLLLLGLGFGAAIRKLKITTIPEIFQVIYKSPMLRQMSAVLSIISLLCILITQGIAARKFFITLGYGQEWIFALFWLVIVLYTVMGGLKAVVKTDILQALFVVGALSLSFAFTVFSPGPAPATVAVGAATASEIPWMGWLCMPIAFALIEQDMGQRCFASKNASAISYASIIAAVMLLATTALPIYFSTKARALGIEIPPGSSVLMTAITSFTNPAVTAFFSCAILMAIISTADSLICAISSNLACDFPIINKLPSSQKVACAQMFTLVIGMISLVSSFFFVDIISIMILSYEMSVVVLFVPITMAIWSKKPSYRGALYAMTGGAIGFVLFRIIPVPLPRELCALALSYGGFWLGQRITAQNDARKGGAV